MDAKAPRSKRILIQPRRSAKAGETYHHGDFRPFADVGGKVEPLCAADARIATTDPVEAARLYAERVAAYEALRSTAVPSDGGSPAAIAPGLASVHSVDAVSSDGIGQGLIRRGVSIAPSGSRASAQGPSGLWPRDD
jgi:hypothetical protein